MARQYTPKRDWFTIVYRQERKVLLAQVFAVNATVAVNLLREQEYGVKIQFVLQDYPRVLHSEDQRAVKEIIQPTIDAY